MAYRIRQDLRQLELDIDEILGELGRLKKENREKDDEIEALNEELNHYRNGKTNEWKSNERKTLEKNPHMYTSKNSSNSQKTSISRKPPDLVLESTRSSLLSSTLSTTSSGEVVISRNGDIVVTKSLTPASSSSRKKIKKDPLLPEFLDEVPVKLSEEAVSVSSSHVKFYPDGDGEVVPRSPTASFRKDPFGTSSTGSLLGRERPGSPKRLGAYKVKKEPVQDEFEQIQVSSSETALSETSPSTNVLQFSTGKDATTVFLDFAIKKDIWRCDLRFFHDPLHNNESADFGVANSSTIKNFLDKWLYNNVDTCVYLLDRTKPCVCVGRAPKPLISQYNVRSGTEIAVEVDYEEKHIRFYTNTYPIPFTISNPHESVHVGITGRWRQRLELISMRRVSHATLRISDRLPTVEWTAD